MSGDQKSANGGRLIDVGGAFNFRDLGGVVTSTGHVLATGRVFRSATLASLTAAGIETIQTLGIRTVLDLRSDEELADQGTFRHDLVPVRWEHLTSPFGPPGSAGPDDRHRRMLEHPDPMALLYVEIMRGMAAEFGRAIRILSNPANLPAVFHCTNGKDRTGLLAAIIQLTSGVPLPLVLQDYERSNRFEDLVHAEMLERHPELGELPPEKLDRMATTNRQWLLSALSVAGSHGGLGEWLDSNGCPVHHQVRLRTTLLELPRA